MPFSTYDRLGNAWMHYRENGVDIVVLLTEPHEYLVHAQRDLPAFYRAEGLEVIHYPIEDFSVPKDKDGLEDAIRKVIQKAQAGVNIAVHCMGGLGRTGFFLACLAKRHFGFGGRESIRWIRQFIPDALENNEQEAYVLDF